MFCRQNSSVCSVHWFESRRTHHAQQRRSSTQLVGCKLYQTCILSSSLVTTCHFQFINNIKKHDKVLLRIPAFEKAVSQVLLDIKVVRRYVLLVQKTIFTSDSLYIKTHYLFQFFITQFMLIQLRITRFSYSLHFS